MDSRTPDSYATHSRIHSEIPSEHSNTSNISIQVFVCDYNIQKKWQFRSTDTVWKVKQTVFEVLSKDVRERDGLNYGLFLPPCNGRAGKFLLEERPLRDYPFQDCVPYLEFKYKKRVYKMLNLDEKLLKTLHSKAGFKRFLDYVENRHIDKVEKLCSQGFDPNFHNLTGETPLTLAALVPNNAKLVIALVAGGAHLDFRSLDGQTALHKAACLSSSDNVKTLLSLGASPNCRDSLNLTPLYHCTLNVKSCPQTAEILLRDYAEIGITDVHGNQEIHQACKNGLNCHLEHLLFYGADLNHRNNNGNTPLHVCAVNNQESCARILLFRGGDSSIVNNQGQTAYHVANLVGHVKVADVIRAYSASQAVPYRSQPRYNSKRRFAFQQQRSSMDIGFNGSRNSSSCSYSSSYERSENEPGVHDCGNNRSVCSTPNLACELKISGNRTVPNEFRPALMQSLKETLPRPSQPSRVNSTCSPVITDNLYACQERVCDDANIPRILVIPRGKKGFGFILRGAKKIDPSVSFQPTLEIPALQYFEGVDTNGMAMKAGLKPGDFLLEINNVDVRRASHDQVVRLIQMASDTITIKVITVDLHDQNSLSLYATMNRTTRAAMSTNHYCQPQHSRRLVHTLSHGFGRQSQRPSLGIAPGQCTSMDFDERHFNSVASKSVENLPAAFRDPSMKVASVRNRSAHRRVSVTEVEQLMQRHNGTCANVSSANFEQCQLITNDHLSLQQTSASPGPRVYASVAEMKRQKKHVLTTKPPPSPIYRNNPLQIDMDNSASSLNDDAFDDEYNDANYSPNVANCSQCDAANLRMNATQSLHHGRHYSMDERMQRDFNQNRWSSASFSNYHNDNLVVARSKPSPPVRRTSADCTTNNFSPDKIPRQAEPAKVAAAPPPPPPPPTPGDLCKLSNGSTLKKALAQRRAAMVGGEPKEQNCPVSASNEGGPRTYAKQQRGPSDFESDLKLAIARQRNRVDNNLKPTDKQHNDSTSASKHDKTIFNPSIKGSATSLKESVANSIMAKTNQASNKTTSVGQQKPELQRSTSAISNNFIGNQTGSALLKKDSGYTSSRNSLAEHAEFSDSSHRNVANGYFGNERIAFEFNDQDSLNGDAEKSPSICQRQPLQQNDMLRQNKVTVISQKIEENINNSQLRLLPISKSQTNNRMPCRSSEQDSMSLTSTLSSSLSVGSDDRESPKRLLATKNAIIIKSRSIPNQNDRGNNFAPEVPPPDYDLVDSGNGSDPDDSHGGNAFSEKSLLQWTNSDVCHWLDSMRMSEYKTTFTSNKVNGQILMHSDRAEFIKLGVTRVAHRVAMENSLRQFKQDEQL